MAEQFIPKDELNFEKYRDSLKGFYRGKGVYKDVDFEGSNISLLIDILARNTVVNGHYLNFTGTEMFLDSAQTREAIVSRAKELNYLPRGRVSARCTVNIEIIPDDTPVSITMPRFYSMKTMTSGSQEMRFLTNEALTFRRDTNGRYIIEDVVIYEGTINREKFVVRPTVTEDGRTTYNQRFNLTSERIDTDSIEVIVYDTAGSETGTVFSRAHNLYGLDGETPIYFVRGYRDNYYEIEFGDGVLGQALVAGNVVEVISRNSKGVDGNGTYTFAKTAPVGVYGNIVVTTTSRSTGGAERESNESLEYNATKFYQVQDRAVIASDYRSLIKQHFPEIQEVFVFGGEEIDQYGRVVIVLKPYNVEGMVDNKTKKRIIEFIKTKAGVPQAVIVDPEYYYLGVQINVAYDKINSGKFENEIGSAIIESLVNLNKTKLSRFNTTIFQSDINKTITGSSPWISGCDIDMSLVKRLFPNRGRFENYTFTVDTGIKRPIEGEYVSSSEWGITSTVFQYIYNDRVINVIMQDNGLGAIHLYQIVDGNKVKLPVKIGDVNYETGAVTFGIDIYSYDGNYIEIRCELSADSVSVEKRKFVSVDPKYIGIKYL